MLLKMFLIMMWDQQEVGDVSEHVTTASFNVPRSPWQHSRSHSNTTTAEQVWKVQVEEPVRSPSEQSTDPESVWGESTSAWSWTSGSVLQGSAVDRFCTSWSGSSPADQHLVSVFDGVELQSLLVAVDLKLRPDHLHKDVGQNNELHAADRHSELTSYCNSTDQVQFIQDEYSQTVTNKHIEGSSHLHAGVGELQVCSRNLQQSVQEPLHLLNQHGGCTAGNTALSSTRPELNILLTLCELCVTDRAPTLSHEFTWKFLLDRLPLGVVRKHEGDLWWGEDSTFSLISLSRLLTDSQRLILL